MTTLPYYDEVKKYLPSVPKFGRRKPKAIAANVYGTDLVVVLEDGRKITFDTSKPPVKWVDPDEESAVPEIEAEPVAPSSKSKGKEK